jgi:two-component system cell cycle response regulator
MPGRSRRLPRRLLYPLYGIGLAQGAPLGLLALRAFVDHQLPSSSWASAEVLQDPLLYVYLAGSTSIVFAAAAAILGRTVDRLDELATSDALTGLHNRRHFDSRLQQELARARRYGTELSLLLVDLDGLKPLNDRHGHEAGDEALKMIARALNATCRTTDIVARVGGDEFAVLAPFTSAAVAVELADRVRAKISATALPWGHVTASIGIADVVQTEASHPEALLAAADRALYEAKAAGRDHSSVAPPSSAPARQRA